MAVINLATGEALSYPDGSSPDQTGASGNMMMSSVATILNRRQRYTFVWANDAARTAQTGMVQGSQGYQTDTKTEYMYDDGSWQTTFRRKTSFTPSWSGFTPGSSTVDAWYQISGNITFGVVNTTLASGFSLSSTVALVLPTPPASPVNLAPIGQATYVDTGTGFFVGALLMTGGGNAELKFFGGGNPSFYGAVNSTSPFTWATADQFRLAFQYGI